MVLDFEMFLQSASKVVKDSAIGFADAVLDGSIALSNALKRLDDQVLQKKVMLRFMAEYAKEVYQSGIQQYANEITRDCSASQPGLLGTAQCVDSYLINLPLGGLNAVDPLFYIKSVFITIVNVSYQDGYLTKEEADSFKTDFEMAFLLADIAKLDKINKKLKSTVVDLKSVRKTVSGAYDKRFKATKEMIRLLNEALEPAVTKTGEAIAKWRKTQGQ